MKLTGRAQKRTRLKKLISGKRGALFFPACETSPCKTGVHAHYQGLLSLPENVKRKILLYHYQPDPVYNPEADGFRGFVIKGQAFELPERRKHYED